MFYFVLGVQLFPQFWEIGDWYLDEKPILSTDFIDRCKHLNISHCLCWALSHVQLKQVPTIALKQYNVFQ